MHKLIAEYMTSLQCLETSWTTANVTHSVILTELQKGCYQNHSYLLGGIFARFIQKLGFGCQLKKDCVIGHKNAMKIEKMWLCVHW